MFAGVTACHASDFFAGASAAASAARARDGAALASSDTAWVRNGDRWRITTVHRDGSIDVQHLRNHNQLTLPADYVAAAAELGYASTIHGAQGISVDTMHGLATGAETRQQLYTMLTRGAEANHVYLQVAGDGDPHDVLPRSEVFRPEICRLALTGLMIGGGSVITVDDLLGVLA